MMISGDPPEDLSPHYKRVYPGEQSLPLTRDGQQQFRKSALEGDDLDRIVGEGILLTGLKPGTYSHMRPSWLEREGDKLYITVPGGEHRCDLSPGQRGQSRLKGGHPCRECRKLREGYWSLNGTTQPRRVLIPETSFAKFLEQYLSLHQRLATPATVGNRIRRVADRAGIVKSVTGANLRMTFGKMAAEKGFDGEILRRIMGYPDSNMGRSMTQRYFMLSVEHENPPYYCGEETGDGPCRRNVFFPEEMCSRHS